MGASVEYLHRHPKTGRLSFRRAFPPLLRLHIPGQPVELKRSLRAKLFTAPGASERFQDAEIEYERVTSTARKAASGTFDQLDPPMLAYLAALHGQWLHRGSEVSVQAGRAEANLDGWEWLLDDFREWRLDRDADAAVKYWGNEAHGLLED